MSAARRGPLVLAIGSAVASLYAITWALIHLTADRSAYIVVSYPDGSSFSTVPGIPFPHLFPDPGGDAQPMVAAVLMAGCLGLAISTVLVVARLRRRT